MSMNEKTDVQVIINDKRYTISGYESSDYLQHIANYINEKLQSFKKQDAYNHLDMDMKNILLAINLSDDYFKAQKLAEENKQQQGEVEQEMFRMKHEIVSRDEEMKALKEQLKKAEDQAAELEKKTIRLETEMEQKNQELEQKAKELDKKTKEIDEKNKELQRRAVMPAQQPVRQVYNAPVQPVKTQSVTAPVSTGAVTQSKPQTVSVTSQSKPAASVSAAQTSVPVKPQQAPVSQVVSNSAGAPSGQTAGTERKQASAINAAATAEKPVEDVMSGIQPAKEDKKDDKQPSIAAFEFEADPKEENEQTGQNGGKGRKNFSSRRSQNKRK